MHTQADFYNSWKFTDMAEHQLPLETLVLWALHSMKLAMEIVVIL